LQGLQGSTGPQGPIGPEGPTEAVLILGKLQLDQSLINTNSSLMHTPNLSAVPLCQETASFLYYVIENTPLNSVPNKALGRGPGPNANRSYGAKYSDDGSWVGINRAALCTGTSQTLNSPWETTYQESFLSANAIVGLGLMVEIDSRRLPEGSLGSCFFTIESERPIYNETVGGTLPGLLTLLTQRSTQNVTKLPAGVTDGGALISITTNDGPPWTYSPRSFIFLSYSRHVPLSSGT
jgi:hypothetical protein